MRMVAYCIVITTYLLNLGCQSMQEVPASNAVPKQEFVYAAVYPSGEVVAFSETKPAVILVETRTVEGISTGGTRVSIPLDSLLYVRVERYDGGKTALAGLGIALLIVGIVVGIAAAATATVWSHEGSVR